MQSRDARILALGTHLVELCLDNISESLVCIVLGEMPCDVMPIECINLRASDDLGCVIAV